MNRWSWFAWGLIALFLILSAVQTVTGQDITADVAGWQTQVAADSVLMTETAVVPTVVPDAPIVINVDTSPASDERNTTAVMGWVGIGVAGGLLLYRLLFAKTDAERVAAIEATRSNRVAMDQAEAAYQRASVAQKQAFDAMADVLIAVKGLIPGKADDAFAGLVRDVQTPGVPASPTE